jgi:hypothetical protein
MGVPRYRLSAGFSGLGRRVEPGDRRFWRAARRGRRGRCSGDSFPAGRGWGRNRSLGLAGVPERRWPRRGAEPGGLPGLFAGRGLARGGGVGLIAAGLDPLDQLGELGEKRGEQRQEQRGDGAGQPAPFGLLPQILEDRGEAFDDAGGWGRGHAGKIEAVTVRVK